MKSRLAERPPVGAPVADGDDPRWGRPHAVVLLERPVPAPWSLRQVAWFARRLGAQVLVATVVTHGRGLDDLDEFNLRVAQEGVQQVTADLASLGIRASGEVRLAQYGDQGLAASDLADGLDADLVIVLARRGSWFGLFPGSLLAHQLMRQRRRPVLVIADHEPRRSWTALLLGLVGAGAASG